MNRGEDAIRHPKLDECFVEGIDFRPDRSNEN